jgi:hypothetical protein
MYISFSYLTLLTPEYPSEQPTPYRNTYNQNNKITKKLQQWHTSIQTEMLGLPPTIYGLDRAIIPNKIQRTHTRNKM